MLAVALYEASHNIEHNRSEFGCEAVIKKYFEIIYYYNSKYSFKLFERLTILLIQVTDSHLQGKNN